MTITYELGHPKKDGSRRVSILVCQGSGVKNRKRIPTEIHIEKNEITKSGRIKNDAKLRRIEDFIRKAKEDLLDRSIYLRGTANEVVEAIKADHEQRTVDLFSFTEAWLTTATIKGKKNYISMLNSIRRFWGDKPLFFTDITYDFLERYSMSLMDKPRARTLYLGQLRHIWNEAERKYDEAMPRSPFRRFRVPKQVLKGQRAVDISVVKKIYEYDGKEKRAILARDVYIMSFCLCGMNSVDLYNATILDGRTIKFNRTKTKDRRSDSAYMEIEIPDFLMPICRKYFDKGSHVFNFHKSYATPANFNRALNMGLGWIFGVDKQVPKSQRPADEPDVPDFYTARHTWATIARNDLRISKDVINDALAHVDKDMQITDLYIKKDFSFVNLANKQVVDYVFGQQ